MCEHPLDIEITQVTFPIEIYLGDVLFETFFMIFLIITSILV